jgi:hypothetical protein
VASVAVVAVKQRTLVAYAGVAAVHGMAVGKVSTRGQRQSVASCREGAGTDTWSCGQSWYSTITLLKENKRYVICMLEVQL